jgi:hypothetical protein
MSKKKRRGGGKRTYLNRSGWLTRHHILSKSQGGKDVLSNLIRLDDMRHAGYHLLFKNLSFREAAALLIRAAETKERQDAKHHLCLEE